MGTKITPFNLHTSVDSHVKGLIDSDYIQARSGSGGTDSASTQAMIDSNFANDITFGGAAGTQAYTFDGSDVTFDSAGVVQFDVSDQSLKFGDNIKAKFGASAGLQIEHTGSFGFITTNFVQVKNAGGVVAAQFFPGNSSRLHFNNTTRIETTDSGATITGNLGIGTVSPAVPLDVVGQVRTTDGGVDLRMLPIDGSNAGIVGTYSNDDLVLNANSAERMRINTSGNVGIGTTTPSTKLEVAGDLTLTETADGGPNLNIKSNDHSDAADYANEGFINFIADNDADQEVTFSRIGNLPADVTDGTEDGRIRFDLISNGSMTGTVQMGHNYLFLTNDNHVVEWHQTRGTSYNIGLTTTTPTASRLIYLPDADGTVALTSDITVTASSTTTLTNKTLTSPTITDPTITGTMNATGAVLSGSSPLVFEGSGVDANETTLAVQNPTADRTITLPNMTGSIKELLISEGSMNASELVFNSGTITTEYSELRLVLSNCVPSSPGQTVNLRVGSGNSQDTGSNYGQAIYYSGYYGSTTAYSINTVSATQSLFYLATGYAALGTGTGQNAHFEITFLNPNTSSYYKLLKINSMIYSYWPMLMGRYIDAAVWKSNAAINYIRVYPNSGNLALQYKLYGVKS